LAPTLTRQAIASGHSARESTEIQPIVAQHWEIFLECRSRIQFQWKIDSMVRLVRVKNPLSPEGTRLLVWLAASVGYLFAARILLTWGLMGNGGQGGIDVVAYWQAGRHVAAGESVYTGIVGGLGAYLYPPPLAQLLAVPSALPFAVFAWGWRIFELTCLRVAVGSWRNAGLALLLWPPVITEIDAGNVHLLIAAAVAQVIRSDGRWVVPAALTKFASLAAVPLALRVDRRRFLVGVAAAFAIVAASFILAPDLWFSYLHFATTLGEPDARLNIGRFVRLPVRLTGAIACAAAAVWRPRFAVVAVTLA
jgi:hypothetical protein